MTHAAWSSALLVAAGGLVPVSAVWAQQVEPGVPAAYVEQNGRLYRVEKTEGAGGVERKTFFDGALAMTPDEFRASIAAQRPVIVAGPARERLATLTPEQPIDLVVVLRRQPAGAIAREIEAAVAPAKAELTRGIRAITGRSLPEVSLPPGAEQLFVARALPAARLAARRTLSAQLDDLERDARQEIARRIGAAVAPDQDALAAAVAGLGGEVTMRVGTMNIVGVRLPAGRVGALAAHPLVAQIDLDHPGAPELDNHRVSLGLDTGFWAAGIDGGVHDVGVLDTGVQQNHPALNTHPFLSNMGVNDTSTHGTGMAGIFASTNATFRGMAYGCDTIVMALAGSINTSMPGMNYIASTGQPECVNYSFGNGTATDGDYTATDQFFDGAVSTFGFMVSKSTGNGGFGNLTITHPAPAYNLMASANMNDFNTQPRADDRIDSSSSRGPTLAGRKKPDITAPGTNSMSCTPSGGFANIGGTSSASPHTGGAIVLLYDMGVTDVMAGKAVLLNTTDAIDDRNTSTGADDGFVAGSLWNRRYGWGYLNLGQAHLHGLDVFTGSVPPAPETADYKLYTGQMFASERATLVWERHVAFNGAMFPTQVESLSDLDLRAFAKADGALLASSASAIDNVEQIDVDVDGLVVLKVEASGLFDPQVPTEAFALATQENFIAADGPVFAGALTHPATVAPGQQFTIEIEVENTGDLPAHAVMATLSGVTVVSGPSPAMLGTVADGGTATVSWTVEAAGANGSYPLSVALASSSYGEQFAGASKSSYTVGGCPADFNGDGAVTIADVLAYLGAYSAGEARADITGDGVVTIQDFLAFLSAYAGGCP